jgi:CheY-like chemotaxis protein
MLRSCVRSDEGETVNDEPPRRISGITEKAPDVIIVEDDPGSRAMFGELLRTNGITARACASGEAAVGLALARRPDVMLIDLNLAGGAPGWVLADSLRADPRTRGIALIAVTGEIEPLVWVVRAFDAYLRKPIETRLLIDLVAHLTASTRAERRRSNTPQ